MKQTEYKFEDFKKWLEENPKQQRQLPWNFFFALDNGHPDGFWNCLIEKRSWKREDDWVYNFEEESWWNQRTDWKVFGEIFEIWKAHIDQQESKKNNG